MAGSIFFYIFFSLFTNSVAVRCFDCHHVAFPRDCAKLTECQPDEHCFTEKIETTSGQVVYNTGCLQKDQCSAINALLVGKRLGYTNKRTTDPATCLECCPDNFCNMKGCGVQEIPLEQRGPYCFNCNSVIDPKACEHVTACLQDEVCLLYSPAEFRGLPETIYASMCGKQSICDDHSVLNMKSSAFHCCRTDFCNDASKNISMTTETTRIDNFTSQTSSMTTEAPLTSYFTSQNTKRISEVSQTMYTKTIATGNHTTESNLRVTTEETTSPSSSTHLSTSSAPSHCSNQGGYQYVKGHHAQLCVHIVIHHSTWEHAREACRLEGGDLVVLDTHQKSLLMRHKLQSKAEYNHSGYWIGAKDFSNHNHFSWINTLPVNKSATDWANGEPDNHTATHRQQCVEMRRDSYHTSQNFKWHDILCSAPRNRICERR